MFIHHKHQIFGKLYIHHKHHHRNHLHAETLAVRLHINGPGIVLSAFVESRLTPNGSDIRIKSKLSRRNRFGTSKLSLDDDVVIVKAGKVQYIGYCRPALSGCHGNNH